MKTRIPEYKDLTDSRKSAQQIFHLIGRIHDRSFEINQNEIQNLLIAQKIREDVSQILEFFLETKF